MSEETPQMKKALESSERGLAESAEWFSAGGKPMVKITAAASELINTGNYSNCTLGPVRVERFVADGDDEHLQAEIQRTQALCEAAIAEERQTVQVLLRANVASAAK